MQSAGLKEKYDEDSEFRLHLYMLTALAFASENSIIE